MWVGRSTPRWVQSSLAGEDKSPCPTDSMRLTPGPYLTITLMANYKLTIIYKLTITARQLKSPSTSAPPAEGALCRASLGGCWTDLSPSYSPQPASFPWWLSTPASILQRLSIPVADSVCSAWSGAGPVLWPGQTCHRSLGRPLGSAPHPNLAPVAYGPCLLALPPAALTRGLMAMSPLESTGGGCCSGGPEWFLGLLHAGGAQALRQAPGQSSAS